MVIDGRLKVLLSLRMFMCAFLLMIGVHSVSAQVSLTTNQTDLKTVIQRIKSKTKYRFSMMMRLENRRLMLFL